MENSMVELTNEKGWVKHLRHKNVPFTVIFKTFWKEYDKSIDEY